MTEQVEQKNPEVVGEWHSRHIRFPELLEIFSGGITLRYKVDEINNVVEYKFAICNPKDQYSRKLGITIADGKQSYFTDLPPFEIEGEDMVYLILSHIFDSVPTLSRQTVALMYNFSVQYAVRSVKNQFYPKP